MKKTKELVFILIIVILVIGNVVYLIKQDAKKENKNAELINITQCSEEFMNNYFEELDKIQENEDKENILIITSETKIQDGYGASEIVEAPNNQYILKYESQEEKNDALENFNTNKELISVEENIAYTLTGDVKYNPARDCLENGMALIDAGHYETEHIVCELLYNILSPKFTDVEFVISKDNIPVFNVYHK